MDESRLRGDAHTNGSPASPPFVHGRTESEEGSEQRCGSTARKRGEGEPERNRPPNGSDVKLRGQGPRAEADAARCMPAFEARDAGGVTPSRWRRNSRLGRRTEAGPRQLLRRVRRRLDY